MDLAIDHGVFTPDSRLTYRTDHVQMDSPVTARMDGDIRLSAGGLAGRRMQANLELRGTRVALGNDHVVTPLEIDGDASVASDEADVTRPWSFAGGHVELHDAVLRDLRWLNTLPLDRKRSWKAEGGRGRVGASATLSSSYELVGSARIRVDGARVSSAEWRAAATSMVGRLDLDSTGVRGHVDLRDLRATASGVTTEAPQASLDGKFAWLGRTTNHGHIGFQLGDWIVATAESRVVGSSLAGELDFGPGAARARLQANDLHVSEFGNGTCPWAEVASVVASADLATLASGSQIGRVEATLNQTAFRWGEFTAAAARTMVTGFGDGTYLAIRLGSHDLRLRNAGGAPKGWQADATSLELTTVLSGHDHVEGPARMVLHGATGQAGKTKLAADLTADLRIRSAENSHRIFDLAGIVRARDVAVGSHQRNVAGWWADFDLDRLHIDTRQDFDFNGRVRAKLRDGLPALYVLASEDEIPGWIPNLLPLQDLRLDLDVERFCRWADLNVVAATGGPLTAAGRFQLEIGETRGAVLVRLAALPLSIGIDFVEDYSDSTLLAGNGWLEKHMVPLTSAATAKHDERCLPQPPKCE
jgi:hypothetical protein